MLQSLQDRKAESYVSSFSCKARAAEAFSCNDGKAADDNIRKAQELFSRYLAGDILADAAIEAYASDGDVAEFLDTLQVLATNSMEDLDTLIRPVAAMNDQEVPSSVNKTNEDTA